MQTKYRIAEIIVDVHVPDVDRVFHYEVPERLIPLIRIGHRVVVPFGHRARVEGYVIGLLEKTEFEKLRPIGDLLDTKPLLNKSVIETARQISGYYLCPLVQILQCFIPPGSRLRAKGRIKPKTKRWVALNNKEKVHEIISTLRSRAPKQAHIVEALMTHGREMPVGELLAKTHASHSSLNRLLEKGIIIEHTRFARRDPFNQLKQKQSSFILNRHQRIAFHSIRDALDNPLRPDDESVILLQGVTGSGKTEVYLRAIGYALSLDKGSIFLVPEISLTPQMVDSFRSTFGTDVALLHSRLSPGERYDEWHRIHSGEANVVVGARSAIFAPVRRLGLIVLDEEHEPSYKQDEAPSYHTREVARVRARIDGAVIVLGSATPDLTSRYAAVKRDTLIVLPERVQAKPMPETDIIDMREELTAGNRSMFSRLLTERLTDAFDRGEQALLFMNRRGYASFLLCRECGYVPGCNLCEVSLTLHLPSSLQCHYCESTTAIPSSCVQCGGPYLRPFGGGTQRIQAEFNKAFPNVKSLRMDVDTTRRKGAHAKMIAAFASKEYDCLIGTQMVAKGLHFPGVTCVGVISADTSLFFPDYRAAERTFQLLTQVAGRAGRGDSGGNVVIQTYAPDNYAIQCAAAQDYDRFYHEEMAFRNRAGYPPFGAMARALWSGEYEDELLKEANRLGMIVESHQSEEVTVLGPSPCPISRIQGRFRYHTLFKGTMEAVWETVKRLKDQYEHDGSKAVKLSVDIDPLTFM